MVEIDSPATPADVIARWPAGKRLWALVSASNQPRHSRARWSILAAPTHVHETAADAEDPLATFPLPDQGPGGSAGEHPPFAGGWIGCLAYELGGAIEPRAACPARRGPSSAGGASAPLMTWARCDRALVHDAHAGRWFVVGDDTDLRGLVLDGPGSMGDQDFRLELPGMEGEARAAYERAVARTVAYIRDGDIYQANIAREIAGRFTGSTRAFFAELVRVSRPWYGAYLETPSGVIASASPELFLSLDASTRRVLTRPMKGTLAGEADPRVLERSDKDRAELNMIVDLMRNDLGRVCEFGSIRVDEERVIEPHGAAGGPDARGAGRGVLQAVATVSGTLRAGLTLRDLIRATFPPGSVTGAPKIRAMQIIDELEGRPRGAYCGCIGYVSDRGDASFSVAIRTACIDPRREHITYQVGAGIVADSAPNLEWQETQVKARPLYGAASAGHAGRS